MSNNPWQSPVPADEPNPPRPSLLGFLRFCWMIFRHSDEIARELANFVRTMEDARRGRVSR